jgi:hypothetical protein
MAKIPTPGRQKLKKYLSLNVYPEKGDTVEREKNSRASCIPATGPLLNLNLNYEKLRR